MYKSVAPTSTGIMPPRIAINIAVTAVALFPSFLQHRVAFWFEFVAGFPFRKFVGVGDLVADFEEKIDILDRAREVPVGIHLIGDLMIIFRVEFVGAKWPVLGSRHQMFAFADVKRRHTDF